MESLKFQWSLNSSCARINGPSLKQLAKTMVAPVHGSFATAAQETDFCWQYWHEPDHYTHLRTPAVQFFPPQLHKQFLGTLSSIAQNHFGCAELSPAWLSLYTDGCLQNWHADKPHGPWAFVFSLTQNPKAFHGGRTMLLNPEVLDYWSHFFNHQKDVHGEELVSTYEPAFGQLLVFDGRIPHGVELVRGVSKPQDGRIVVHGWFTEPRPYVTGPLKLTNILTQIDSVIEERLASLKPFPAWDGVSIFRLQIAPSGKVVQGQVIASTLMDLEKRQKINPVADPMFKDLMGDLAKVKFKTQKQSSIFTLPLSFSSYAEG